MPGYSPTLLWQMDEKVTKRKTLRKINNPEEWSSEKKGKKANQKQQQMQKQEQQKQAKTTRK